MQMGALAEGGCWDNHPIYLSLGMPYELVDLGI